MKKIKITFSINQKLSGHLKNVCVIARNVDQCWEKIHKAMNYKTFQFSILNVEQCEESFPSGIFQSDSMWWVNKVRICKSIDSVFVGAALSDHLEQGQSHK